MSSKSKPAKPSRTETFRVEKFQFSEVDLDQFQPDSVSTWSRFGLGFLYRLVSVCYYYYSIIFDAYLVVYMPVYISNDREGRWDYYFAYLWLLGAMLVSYGFDIREAMRGSKIVRNDIVSETFLNSFARSYRSLRSFRLYCFLCRIWDKQTFTEKLHYVLLYFFSRVEYFFTAPVQLIVLAVLSPPDLLKNVNLFESAGLQLALKIVIIALRLIGFGLSCFIYFFIWCCRRRGESNLKQLVIASYERTIFNLVSEQGASKKLKKTSSKLEATVEEPQVLAVTNQAAELS